jgi:hypothetical protein
MNKANASTGIRPNNTAFFFILFSLQKIYLYGRLAPVTTGNHAGSRWIAVMAALHGIIPAYTGRTEKNYTWTENINTYEKRKLCYRIRRSGRPETGNFR